jgi:dolichol kinase
MVKKERKILKRKKLISRLKIKRAAFHILLGTIILCLSINFYNKVRLILFLVLAFGIILSLLSLRFKLPFIYFMLKKFEKPRYIRKFPGKGTLFFVAGSLLVLKLFSRTMAFASIAILTFADPLASLSGLLFGRKGYKKPFKTFKKIEGTIAGIAIGFFAAAFFVPYIEAILASVAAMLAEALTLKLGGDDVDDNIIVPLAAAMAMYLVIRFLGL